MECRLPSPALFVLVYKAFHQTLTKEFPNSAVLACVNNLAIILPNKHEMKRVLKQVPRRPTTRR